jgi:hypothetical protein
MIGICRPIEHLRTAALHRSDDCANDAQVTAFTEVGHRLENPGGHAVEDKDVKSISQAK